MDKRRIVLLSSVLAVLAVCAITAIIFVLNRPKESPSPQPISVSVKGNLVCLPHKNTSPDQPQTLECAIGLKADNGDYYGLTGATDQTASTPMDKRVNVQGTLTTASKATEKYDIKGSIKIEKFTVE